MILYLRDPEMRCVLAARRSTRKVELVANAGELEHAGRSREGVAS